LHFVYVVINKEEQTTAYTINSDRIDPTRINLGMYFSYAQKKDGTKLALAHLATNNSTNNSDKIVNLE